MKMGQSFEYNRCEQDSNLRGETPLDFESNALTSRPSQLHLSKNMGLFAKTFQITRVSIETFLNTQYKISSNIFVEGCQIENPNPFLSILSLT